MVVAPVVAPLVASRPGAVAPLRVSGAGVVMPGRVVLSCAAAFGVVRSGVAGETCA
jgi:hypothetical protein